MRREFLDTTGGYREELRLAEDYELWMRGMQEPGVVYENLPIPLVIYRTPPVQRWRMIRASARIRMRIGSREGRPLRGTWAALRVLTEGAVEQTGIFGWRNRRRHRQTPPSVTQALGESRI
jgi:hypothetical protein